MTSYFEEPKVDGLSTRVQLADAIELRHRLRETILYLGTQPEALNELHEALTTATFAIARATGDGPRAVAERLFKNMPSDLEWLDILTELAAHDETASGVADGSIPIVHPD